MGRGLAQLIAARDPRFESGQRQFYLLSPVLNKLYRKGENKVKEARNSPFFYGAITICPGLCGRLKKKILKENNSNVG